MRILDSDHDRALKHITLFLTPEEAKSLHEQLDNLIANPQPHRIHVEDNSFTKETTIAIYETPNLFHFDERSRRLIENDE